MKNILLCSLFVSAGYATGCLAASPAPAIDPVGPDIQHATAVSRPGALMVFSEQDVHESGNDIANTYRHYSNYEVWTADGATRLQVVRNYAAQFSDDEPVRLELAPGRYIVKAMSHSFRWVSVPVLIAATRMTTVHLDGAKIDKGHAATDLVYLPNGEVVGSRASM